MISELDGFQFAEMPQEYEAELDKEEAQSDDEAEEIQPPPSLPPQNRTRFHIPVHDGNAAAQSEEEHLMHGRDHNGMYKNHLHYAQLRNKINEQENSHQELFQTVMDKLQDRMFLEQAMQMTDDPVSKVSKSSEAPMGINDNDAKCLVDRYSFLFVGKDTSPANVRSIYSDNVK
jgi:hypothetical protein